MKTTLNEEQITFLSKKGMKELKKEIAQLECDKKKVLRSLRDLDKTFGHDERLSRIEALAELDIIDSKLEDKRLILSTSKLLPRKRSQLRVAIGSVVDLIDKHGRFFRFTLVNSVEANPSDGRISTLSPLGRTLIGKTVKDTVRWGAGCYELLRIS
jgi:transcription elongation factor GreA